MKAVILAGGYGTRISEESHLRPKPMVEIGGKPILWHIMKHFAAYGVNDFIICCGYKQQVIKEYFANYFLYNSDITFDFKQGRNDMIVHSDRTELWRVSVIDTGLDTMTGGRVKRIERYLDNEPFFLTYGDGVSDVNLKEVVAYHKQQGGLLTMTCVHPSSRFGNLNFAENGKVSSFREKSRDDEDWVNAGFMVVEKEFLRYLEGDQTVLEKEPIERCATDGMMNAFRHEGFWQCMDTLREKEMLEKLWKNGCAPWKVWED